MICNENILIENIIKKGNKVLIWGACERNNKILDFFKQHKINAVGYIDRCADSSKDLTYNSLPVYSKDIIKENNFFVFVGLLNTYQDVIEYLEVNNYREFADYWYPEREIVLDGSKPYKDLYGNEYIGENYKIKIRLSKNSKIFIGQHGKFDNFNITVSNNSEIIIKEKCKIELSNITVINNSKYYIGNECVFSKLNSIINLNSMIEIQDKMFLFYEGMATIRAFSNSIVSIQSNVTSGPNLHIEANQNSEIYIGNDCMISYDVVIRAGNGHNIFDLDNSLNISKITNKVTIGRHVWLGHRSCLFNNCHIGDGSIVGINTFVNKEFPKNCSIAGNPARIIKENIAWRREDIPYYDSYDDFKEFDFR